MRAPADGTIDAADPAFSTLLVWNDLDMDGESDEGEIKPLRDYNITALPVTKIAVAQGSVVGDFGKSRTRAILHTSRRL